MIFGINEKINNFDQDTVLLAYIATNIPMLLVLWSRVTYGKGHEGTISEEPTCTYIKHLTGCPLDIFNYKNINFCWTFKTRACFWHKVKDIFFRRIQLLSHC